MSVFFELIRLSSLDTLKCEKLFFSSMVSVLVDHMGDVFPELRTKVCWISEALKSLRM